MKIFISYLKRYAWTYKWWFFWGVFFIAGTKILSVAIIELTKNAIDGMSLPTTNEHTIVPFVWGIVGCAFVSMIMRAISRHLFFTPGRMIEYNIRNEYFSKLLFLQRDFFVKHETGDLVSRCTHDITFVRSVFGFSSLQVFNVSLALFFGLTAMLRMDMEATMYLLFPMIISYGIIQFNILLMFKYWREGDKKLGVVSSFCLSSYKGVSVIQGYNSESVFTNKFDNANQEFLDISLKLAKIRCFAFPLISFVGALSIVTILWIIGPKVINGELTLGQVMAFIGYITMVLPPLMSLGWMLNSINRAVPAMERLDEILLTKPTLLEITQNLPVFKEQATHLNVRNLCYTHLETLQENSEEKTAFEQNKFSIRNINLDLSPGKVLGIVGETGSGKTTLVDCIVRLNQIAGGQIYLENFDAAHSNLKAYRSYFSVVPQRPFLFSTTLRENLRIALPPDISEDKSMDDKILKALEVAGFIIDLKQLPDGLDTIVGEKGIMLSGGQRQRVALARALLKDAAIYVLDDVLSAVDHETESKIIDNLRLFSKQKSFIIVSHRVSAVQWADEILVMENGTITDRGSHSDLIAKEGFYKEIYEYQGQSEWNPNSTTNKS